MLRSITGCSSRTYCSLLAVLTGTTMSSFVLAALPPVPVPPQNPITEPKRVLGKILFFDEQLSSSNVVSCATCHQAGRNGTDPRIARAPGADGVINTGDDIFGSPGVIHSDANNKYVRDGVFALNPQITTRAANPVINAAYFTDLFWDGRARSAFTDPQTGSVVIPSGGALESQSVGPPASSVEMAHEAMNWTEITEKLGRVRPLDLATNIPADVAAVLASKPSYQTLFQAAFGDGHITSARIAMAIATYERTLISDQSPWDRFVAGDTTALTPGQQAGLNNFQARACSVCHAPPLFSDNTFRNIGLRPIAQDNGRQTVTGNAADRGKFKAPSLRNLALRPTFMHTGQFTNIGQVFGFYIGAGGVPPGAPIRDNRDPLMDNFNPQTLPPQVVNSMQDFLLNGLLDPRVQAETFPFDRATLYTQRAAQQPALQGTGVPGSGSITPQIIVQSPPMIGLKDFRVGLNNALGGASASLSFSTNPPVNGRITPTGKIASVVASGVGNGQGLQTVFWTINPAQFSAGQTIFLQWSVADAGAVGGEALSPVARITFFCGSGGCPGVKCNVADITGLGGVSAAPDNQLTVDDIITFVNAFIDSSGCPGTAPCSIADVCGIGSDLDPDGQLTVDDLISFFNAYGDGC